MASVPENCPSGHAIAFTFAKCATVVVNAIDVTMRAFRPARGARIETPGAEYGGEYYVSFAPLAGRGLKPHNKWVFAAR